ncbi:MAG TPA: hypothetical protein P5348_09170, partial [Bacteroidales bacterium]|nr:hypothetical protein [Bacteroidales bacterium]
NNYLIPTFVMLFLEDISDITGKRKYARSAKKALDWISENPVKTWNWQGQFEDVAYFEPFYLKDFIATKPGKKII